MENLERRVVVAVCAAPECCEASAERVGRLLEALKRRLHRLAAGTLVVKGVK